MVLEKIGKGIGIFFAFLLTNELFGVLSRVPRLYFNSRLRESMRLVPIERSKSRLWLYCIKINTFVYLSNA